MPFESEEFIGSEWPAKKAESEVKSLTEKIVELEALAKKARQTGKFEEAKELDKQRRGILTEQRRQLQKRSSLKKHEL